MSAPKSAVEAESSTPLPKSSRVYVGGEIHPEIRVPMRQIELAPTKSFDGTLEELRSSDLYSGYDEQMKKIEPFVESVGADGMYEVLEHEAH